MSLPFRCNRGIPLGAGLACAALLVLAVPGAARAWHGDDDDWRPRHHWHYHHHGWERHWFRSAFPVPPPGYYPMPVYSAPCPEDYDDEDEGHAYYPAPPVYVPAPSVSFGFVFGR